MLPDNTLSLPYIKALMCAALTPALQNILVFDVPYSVLNQIATQLQQMLKIVTGEEVKQIYISGLEMDDDLWGRPGLLFTPEEETIRWHNGLFFTPSNPSQVQLIVIPDLTRLSLVTLRTCVMLIGADVAHLERYGQHLAWHPRLCWLVGCPISEVGMLSPHLLDRFSLRLHWQHKVVVSTMRDNIQFRQILDQLNADEEPDQENALPVGIAEQLQKAVPFHAVMTEEALKHIFDYKYGTTKFHLLRREIALMRVASAVARIEQAHQVTKAHVTQAAELIHLPLIKSNTQQAEKKAKSQLISPSINFQEDNLGAGNPSLHSDQQISTSSPKNVYYPEKHEDQELALPNAPGEIYPEDKAPLKRKLASLVLPTQHSFGTHSERGIAVGVEHTSELHDIAIVHTLLAALPFQVIRGKRLDQPVRLTRSDLRKYRRTPPAESTYILLLDYTSMRQCNWREKIEPYLKKAYIERARIFIIQVGSATAMNELRAELIAARNINVPRIEEALEVGCGRATPLAHGLDLALQTLRQVLHQGRNTSRQAFLIVISDGRGNIPLEASQNGFLPDLPFIQRQGVYDALRVAEKIRYIQRLHNSILMNVQPKYYPEIPMELARTLNASIIDLTDLSEREKQ